jgi:RNA-directed DNA polymerase
MSILEDIAIQFGATRGEIAKLVASAPRRYKTYQILKRNGDTRTIAQPAAELKIVQRFLMEERLTLFPVHNIAMAYVKDRGIFQNAKLHASSDFILKLDFSSFFPSIVPRDLERVNRRQKPSPLEKSDLEIYYNLLFWGEGSYEPKRLSIGAPSSPMMSNIIMHALDCEAAALADRFGLVVSRYADDITVSGSDKTSIIKFETSFRRAISLSTSPKLQFNEEKRGLYSRGQRRMVTGLIITPQGKISIGRERKRTISTLVHRFILGSLSNAEVMHTKGLLGFALSIEPEFILSLRDKYNHEVINTIMSADHKRIIDWLDEE